MRLCRKHESVGTELQDPCIWVVPRILGRPACVGFLCGKGSEESHRGLKNQEKAETWSFGFKVQHPDPLVKYDLMDVGPWLVRVSSLGPHHWGKFPKAPLRGSCPVASGGFSRSESLLENHNINHLLSETFSPSLKLYRLQSPSWPSSLWTFIPHLTFSSFHLEKELGHTEDENKCWGSLMAVWHCWDSQVHHFIVHRTISLQ